MNHKSLKNISLFFIIYNLILLPLEIYAANLFSDIITIINSQSYKMVIIKGTILIIILSLIYASNYYFDIIYEKKKNIIKNRYKLELLSQILKNDISKLHASQNGQILENLSNDLDTVIDLKIAIKPQLIVGIISTIAFLIYFFIQNRIMAILLLIISLVQIIPPKILQKYYETNYVESREEEARITDCMLGGFQGFLTIKSYKLEKWYCEKLRKIHLDYLKVGNKSEVITTISNSSRLLLKSISQYGTYGILGLIVLKKLITLNIAMIGITLSSDFYSTVQNIFECIPKYSVGKLAMKRIDTWYQPTIENYHLLDIMELNKQPEKRVLIITGENGSGKTTLFLNLIGINENNENSYVSKKAKYKIISKKISKKMSDIDCSNFFYIPQDDCNLTLTPMELYEMNKVTEKDVCLQYAMKLGLSKELLENAFIDDLSGGEKKKVYLALALSQNKEYLLLDEPTNSLDIESKISFMECLVAKKQKVIIISHDEKIMPYSDIIYDIREINYELQ